MFTVKFVRENAEILKQSIKKRFKNNESDIDLVIKYYDEWISIKKQVDDLRHRRNKASEEINLLKKQGRDIHHKVEEIKKIPQQIQALEQKEKSLLDLIENLRKNIPNILHSTVPVAGTEAENKVVAKFGKIKKLKNPKSHIDIIQNLNLADIGRAAKVSGARFYYLKNELVELDNALLQFALDFLKKKGFALIRTPDLISGSAMSSAAELQDFQDTLYKIDSEDLFLIGTAEQSLAPLHMNETLEKLPIKYAGISNCYRKEAGTHGKDTKGIFRVHEFRKIEQFIIAEPENSYKFLEEMISNSEKIFKKLNLPYRIVNIASGALNSTASKKYDLEVWMPAQNTYREMVSCSNCTDYQSMSLNIKNSKKQFVHMLNGTAIATPRILVAIIENCQQPDGSIKIPKVLHKYLSFKVIRQKHAIKQPIKPKQKHAKQR